MCRPLRLAIVACVSLLGLTFVQAALAKYDPKLFVTASGNAVTLNATLTNDDDTTAAISFYAPPGWEANLAANPGTDLGAVSGTLNALDLDPGGGGLPVPVSGTLRVDNPANYVANRCVPGVHQAVWLLALSAAGNPLQPVPMYVDRTTGAEAAFSSVKVVICLPPRDLPQGTPGRATLGVKLVQASLTAANVFTPGESSRWTALFVPYVPPATIDPSTTVEAQAVLTRGVQLRIGSRKLKKNRARVTGRLTAGGEGLADVVVRLTANGRSAGTARTNDNGSFTKTLRVVRTTTFRARATAAAREEQGGCEPALPLPTGGTARCTTVSFGAVSAASNSSKVTVKKKATKRRRR
jgi:hypothetical protein